METMNGYKLQSTFWMDFTLADAFGIEAVKGTYRQAFDEWKGNHIYLTELVLVLNWKIWQHYQKNKPLAALYNDLWNKTAQYAQENLTGEELRHYYDITD